MEIKMRVDILLESGLITKEVYDLLLEIVEMFNKEHQITLTEENGGMFITHLSAAITRMNKGEPIEELDSAVIDDVRSDKNYSSANVIYENIKNMCKLDFPLGEEIFIITHICSILNN